MTRRALLLGSVGLLILGVLAYSPTNGSGFIWDDPSYLTENPTIREPLGLLRIFASPLASPQYYPMVFAGFWAEYRLWGLEPAGYHRVNVALHILNALLVWRVAGRWLSAPAALIAAAIFALHPVEVESVAWITERKNVLSATFYLASLLAYERRGRGWYALAFVLYLGALGSKTVACSLPAAILVLAWMDRGRVGWADVRPLLPFFASGLVAGSFTSWLERNHVGAAGPEWAFSPVDRALIAGRAIWFYAGKLAWPANLSFIYPRWRIDPSAWWQYAYPVAALGLLATLWAIRGRVGRAPLASVLLFAGTLVPALGFFNIYPMRYSFVADHFQYLASLALIVPAGWLIDRVARPWPIPGRVATVALLLALGLATYSRCLAFRDAETLWIDTLAKSPDCWMAHNNLGAIYLDRHLFDRARPRFDAALALKPDYTEAHSNLGTILEEWGQLDEAEAHLRRALDLDPSYWRARFVLGLVRRKQGRDAEAADCFRATLKLKPDYRAARSQLASMNLR